MSELLTFTVLARFPSAEKRDRLAFYLGPETRPDFPEEAPEAEARWVEAFEFLPEPDLEFPDHTTLIASFHEDSDMGEAPKSILGAVALTGPSQILSYSFLGDDEWYEHFEDGKTELIWAVEGLEDPDDDARYNRNLSEEEQQQILNMEDESQALLYLADIRS